MMMMMMKVFNSPSSTMYFLKSGRIASIVLCILLPCWQATETGKHKMLTMSTTSSYISSLADSADS